MSPGRHVAAGERIAWLGDATVNGGWPPHLHLQIIGDMLGREGEFPGVAAPSEREIWLSLCPDANLIAGVPADRLGPKPASPAALLTERRRRLGSNLSLSYSRPIAMARGYQQYLYDVDGRRFLDGVNNVPHVGHNHPRVVEAAARQLAVLNTNTRYLHESSVDYARRLSELMPPELSVVYLVCSGSEANELALRLARAYTGHTDFVVLDGAYHGNTSSLVEISPYKYNGPGGAGPAPHVHAVMMPDVYRGPYRAGDPSAGARYARDVARAIERAEAGGRHLAAFVCESLLSCGGQIVLPDGYLERAYAAARAAGAVAIADEVQVGFGRVGTHVWGFETQGVTPDIVTLGKPIGNGFPLGAVVTRPEIAAAFDNGMEYFNTFGGTQAACAVGLAVLDVMRDEQLQAHALEVGARLKRGLQALMADFPLVGDVRGLGLFLGVELVRDRDSLEPAAAQASYIVNRMRDRGVLLSTDGPLHNVLKIKPPLPFSAADADRLVSVLRDVLAEDAAQPR
jgi:4-aminobutyrate aminotransferase-like enzyme